MIRSFNLAIMDGFCWESHNITVVDKMSILEIRSVHVDTMRHSTSGFKVARLKLTDFPRPVGQRTVVAARLVVTSSCGAS